MNVIGEYIYSMEVIRAREIIEEMEISSYPTLKQEAKDKIIKKHIKVATKNEPQKTITTAELAGIMRNGR